MRRAFPLLASLLAACQPGGNHDSSAPGDLSDKQPYAGIGAGETLRFTGTEPFWNGQARGSTLTYTTPENMDGTTITVARFAGRGGVSFSGKLAGAPFDMMVTEGECSDGMSDRTYPFTVTLDVRGETRKGCAWSDEHPYAGPEHP